MDDSAEGSKAVAEQQQSLPSSSSGGAGEKKKQVEVPPHPQADPKAGSYATFFGKHKMAAAISNLQSQINFIQEELDQLETIGNSSAVCTELASSLDSVRDPLLPLTMGPVDDGWDRWFRGAHNSRNHKRWI